MRKFVWGVPGRFLWFFVSFSLVLFFFFFNNLNCLLCFASFLLASLICDVSSRLGLWLARVSELRSPYWLSVRFLRPWTPAFQADPRGGQEVATSQLCPRQHLRIDVCLRPEKTRAEYRTSQNRA